MLRLDADKPRATILLRSIRLRDMMRQSRSLLLRFIFPSLQVWFARLAIDLRLVFGRADDDRMTLGLYWWALSDGQPINICSYSLSALFVFLIAMCLSLLLNMGLYWFILLMTVFILELLIQFRYSYYSHMILIRIFDFYTNIILYLNYNNI